MKDNGFEEVDVYNDPFLALQNFKSGIYGLIILDVAMPKIDGFKLYQEMKKTDDTIKVFFVTSFKVNYHILRDLFSAGGVDINDESIGSNISRYGRTFS